jgi:hypothetical protein
MRGFARLADNDFITCQNILTIASKQVRFKQAPLYREPIDRGLIEAL